MYFAASCGQNVPTGGATHVTCRSCTTLTCVAHGRTAKREFDAEKRIFTLARCCEPSTDEHRTSICELLNHRCARCKVIVDLVSFDSVKDCLSIICDACGCRFCGWCFADCGKDAHAHVRACPVNLKPGELYCSVDVYQGHLRQLSAQRVMQYVRQLPAEIDRVALFNACAGELVPIGVLSLT